LTERVLVAAGIGRGMRVLDVGCGVGDVSFLVAALVGTEGSVVGVDLNADAIKLAEKRRSEQGITSVEFRNSDARSVEPGRLFDAAVRRFVLMFMSDPTANIRQVAQHVRPGGIVAFHEMDGRVMTALAMNQPVRLCPDFRALRCGAELYSRMLDTGLEPDPKPLAEIAVPSLALFARSVLLKIVEVGVVVHDALQQKQSGATAFFIAAASPYE
jgi:ubiquinone/menaquinone biosynthesis C-methylase UbiE